MTLGLRRGPFGVAGPWALLVLGGVKRCSRAVHVPPSLREFALLGSSSQRELAGAAAWGRVDGGVCAGQEWSCQLELQVTVPWELH